MAPPSQKNIELSQPEASIDQAQKFLEKQFCEKKKQLKRENIVKYFCNMIYPSLFFNKGVFLIHLAIVSIS